MRFLEDEEGATAVEYGLIASTILLVILGAVSLMAANTTAMWQRISNHV